MGKLHEKHHKEQLHLIPLLKGVVGMLRDPGHTESVFDIEDGLRDLEAYKLTEEHAKSFPEVAAIVKERYLTSDTPDMEALGKLDEGTLGKTFWHHIEDHGFNQDYFRKIDVKTDLDYILMRVRQTHDLWHVVTGIGPSRIGEVAVKAFEMGQLRRPMAAVITAGAIIRCMKADPDMFGDLLDAIHWGYTKGSECKPFLAQKWELGWDRPLDDWRAEVGLDIGDMTPALKNSWAVDA
jgi:ubiquinone biosynthesis protein Coq4